MILMVVKLYYTNWCTTSKVAKDFLIENNIKFEDINIQENPEAAQEMIKKSGQVGVPVIDIDGKTVIGFDIERMKKVLKLD